MSAPNVSTEKNGPVTTVILGARKCATRSIAPTAEALADAFLAFDADADARVAVLCGDHGTFCAGADLKAVAAATRTTASTARDRRALDPLSTDGPMGPSRMLLSKPVIAAVAGHAVAGGLELALWCDLRVAEEDAVLGVFCRRWGVPLIDGGTIRLPRLIGHGPRARSHPHRPPGRAPTKRSRSASPTASSRAAQARAEAEALAAELAQLPAALHARRSPARPTSSGTSRSIARCTRVRARHRTDPVGETLEGA